MRRRGRGKVGRKRRGEGGEAWRGEGYPMNHGTVPWMGFDFVTARQEEENNFSGRQRTSPSGGGNPVAVGGEERQALSASSSGGRAERVAQRESSVASSHRWPLVAIVSGDIIATVALLGAFLIPREEMRFLSSFFFAIPENAERTPLSPNAILAVFGTALYLAVGAPAGSGGRSMIPFSNNLLTSFAGLGSVSYYGVSQ